MLAIFFLYEHGDKSCFDCALSDPCVNSAPGLGLAQCDSFPARSPPVYHLNDSGGHLSPRLIVSGTRTWHLSIAVRVIFYWWFSSSLGLLRVKPSCLLSVLAEKEFDPSWMKQKGVSITSRSIWRSLGKWPSRKVPRMLRNVIRNRIRVQDYSKMI